MSQTGMWEKIKDVSTVAAGAGVLLYVLGYTVHVIHYYHVLGVEIPLQPLEYIRTGGDFGSSILISIPQLFSHFSDYFPALFSRAGLATATVFVILFYLGLSLLLIVQKRGKRPAKSRWPYWLIGIFLISSLSLLVWQEYKLLTVKKVLQTFDVAKVKEARENIGENLREPLNVRIARIELIYSDYVDSGGDRTEGFERWKDWYNLKATRSTKQSRLSFYLAFLFLNIAVITALWLYRWSLKKSLPTDRHNFLTNGSLSLTLALLILFSFAYAVLGKSYDYPVVIVRLIPKDANESAKAITETQETTDNKTNEDRQTHPVYLVAQTDAEFIVYDRLDFLKIKYIPRSRVSSINQLFVASPFETCATKPNTNAFCEASTGRDSSWIEDF
jgi:hypothetical protein